MNVKVGFTPGEKVAADVGIVIDVLRATSTICQALDSGYEQVVCVGEVDDARALAGPGVALAGERHNVLIEGFDFGNSPRELAGDRTAEMLVLTTTNGTRALLAAASSCRTVLVASLLNLDAVIAEAGKADDVAILCAGVEGGFAIDDAYVAGRIAGALGGKPDDAAIAAIRLAGTFASAEDGIGAGVSAANIRRVGLDEDIPFCAREGVLALVPRVVERAQTSVVVAA
ncbi:MAG TPA: 2-phosphosulfolactate phosphatase [Gaiellaceae bacterium]|nr:2-phosphosulfolactate phosphatase [Gaiellaceae bacterium]